MTSPARPIIRPWPYQMDAKTAAEYVGYTGADPAKAFRAAVDKGLYPQPCYRKGEGLRWRREDLETKVNQIHGIANDDGEGQLA